MTTSKRGPAFRLLAVFFLGSLVGGCSDQGPEDELLQHVENARARWNSARLEQYTYELYRICECTPEMAGPVWVTVHGVDPVAWRYGDGTEVAESLRPHFPSVDGLLDMIEDAIRQGVWDLTVRYDVETGVPLEFRIDYEQFVFDEEAYYQTVTLPRVP